MNKQLNWAEKQAYAKTLTNEGLQYAIKDCLDAAKCHTENEGYYHDEASIYRAELIKRGRKA